MIDLEGETEVDVFPLGTDAIEVDELVSDWCICLYVCTWFNSETRKMVFNVCIKIARNGILASCQTKIILRVPW